MILTPLSIFGAYLIELDVKADERGFFARRFCAAEFRKRGLVDNFVQHSISFNVHRGTLRGLHYQAAPHQETKIVRCTSGSAFDVLADLRPTSPSYGQWQGEVISAVNRKALYIPAGVAHGFQTLDDRTEIDYVITPAYEPSAVRGVRHDDATLAIAWPMSVTLISPRDKELPSFKRTDG